jgi:hypothetical protein
MLGKCIASPLPMALFALAGCDVSHRRLQPTAFGARDRGNFMTILCGAPSAAADAQAVGPLAALIPKRAILARIGTTPEGGPDDY